MKWSVYLSFLLALSGITLFISWKNKKGGKPRILVFTKTAGFYHTSIPAGRLAIVKLGEENGFDVDTSSSSTIITKKNLKKYAAVVFLSTTGNVFDTVQQADFEQYIKGGGGFVGIHAASDTEYDWPWFGKLVGGYFLSHPKIQDATLQVTDTSHLSTAHLPGVWNRKDEWYNFKQLNTSTKVLIRIDESSYQGGANGADHPMAWYHEYDGGRAWYTALGHTDESYKEPLFLQHLLGGIKYAIGKDSKPDYRKAGAKRAQKG
ncbi:ThuA domain-containing protein [Terrimonas sp. NA20]|uniref:ThuA domain-containing protein n=1 Tax=Terrimonas ginsenosidimutans TaxID=2908004 RepID=A0ABS9KLL0_9BACT|nr:ThuA domain-containing protein [Terrimonas ginsenosidimutans]MCG2613213.1 ThuA domain-containing protein [Terrimonas ginsenosidimutans]